MSPYLNTTINGTQSTSCLNPTATKIGYIITYCLLFVVSMAGNTLIGITVYKTKPLRKPVNFFIVNMAMSDLLFPISLFTRKLATLFGKSPWVSRSGLGMALCKLLPFLEDVSSLVSIQSLILIAVDRFGAVVFPLRSPLITSELCRFYILATWFVAMAIQSPFLFALKLVEYPGRLVCEVRWKETFGASLSFENYALAIIIAFFCVPLVSLAILYLIVLLKLKFHNIPGEQSVNAKEQRLKRERNVLKMSIAIVLVFTVCWLPHNINWILFLIRSDSTMTPSCGFQYFTLIAFILAESNCAINPYICFIFSGNYRQGLKNLFSCVTAPNE